MDNPLVSIITPSYNQEEFLEETILSVINQDYPNIEYIVIDGASTDSSVEIIKKYEDKITYWESNPDNGQSDAINKGFALANGTYVGWINSDDYYLPGAIKSAVREFKNCESCGIVFADVLAVDRYGKILNLLRYGDWGLRELLQFTIIGQPSVFMRNDILKQAGYLEKEFDYMLDHNLWIKMASLAEMKYTQETWSAARYHDDAKNISKAASFGQEAFKVVEWIEKQEDLNQYYHQDKNKIVSGAHWINARYLSEAGEYRRSFLSYLKCFFLNPLRVIKDWKRFIYTLFALFGVRNIQKLYTKIQYKRYNHISKDF